MSYYYEDMSYYSYTVPEHYEDSLNYSYTVPAYYSKTLSDSYDTSLETTHYIDTPPYDDEDHLVPTYDDDRLAPISPTLYESEANVVTVEEGIYFEEDIHPAYRDPPANNYWEPMKIQLPTTASTTINDLSHDCIDPTHLPTNIDNAYSSFSDEELEQRAQWFEETLQEMINWDIEDAENKALGKFVPGSQPPPQPY